MKCKDSIVSIINSIKLTLDDRCSNIVGLMNFMSLARDIRVGSSLVGLVIT